MTGAIRGGLRRLRGKPDAQPQPHPDLVRLTEDDRRYLTTLYDDSTPLPPGADEHLRQDNPELIELRRRYAALDAPVLSASRWSAEAVEDFLDLRYFRGETLITWHYRELRRISELKFFVFLGYVRERDQLGLLDRLDEDGAFGCWTFSYPDQPTVSRDLLESVNEISFLDRSLGLSRRKGLRILDIGAGYGRLAHRMTQALPHVIDYACIDAVAESTFVSEYYLRHRGADRTRVMALDRIDADLGADFDLAINIHSFSECTLAAIDWWIDRLRVLGVEQLFIVPNEPNDLLSLEQDGSRLDYAPLLGRAGYREIAREPVIADDAVRGLLDLHDSFFVFERVGS